jgi:TctA family transporter
MKFVMNRLIYSLAIGLVIAGVIDVIADFKWLNQPWIYLQSMVVSCIISFTVEYLYKKVIIRKQYSNLFKRILIYLATLIIYTLINMIFLGLEIFLQYQFYLVAIMIVLMLTPVINRLNKSMTAYSRYLKAKQK